MNPMQKIIGPMRVINVTALFQMFPSFFSIKKVPRPHFANRKWVDMKHFCTYAPPTTLSSLRGFVGRSDPIWAVFPSRRP